MKRYLLIGICCCVYGLQAQNQSSSKEKVLAEILERYIENTEATVDYTDLQDQLSYFMQYKLDLNSATQSDWKQLFWLSDQVIGALLKHRELYGDFLSVYELQAVENIDERTVYYLSFFVETANDRNTKYTLLRERFYTGKHHLIVTYDRDLQQAKGYQTANGFLGPSYRQVTRYRYQHPGGMSYGFTGEKDAGEIWFNSAQKVLYDFQSAHLYVQQWRNWKHIAIGDYQVSTGQGLTFASGLAPRKSAYVLDVQRSFQTVRPYRSVNENDFLRGMAATYAWRKAALTSWVSHKRMTTNRSQGYPFTESTFSSIQTSGLHRTLNEWDNRKNVWETIVGMHAVRSYKMGTIGFTATHSRYDARMEPATAAYQRYAFRGNQLSNAGIHWNYIRSRIQFFGECAVNQYLATAVIAGANITLHQKLSLVSVLRNYSKQYTAIYAQPFGEYSDGRNEKGWYTGCMIGLNKRWALNLYMDLYQSPWLRYAISAPSRGSDFLAECQWNRNKNTQVYFRLRNETSMRNASLLNEQMQFVTTVARTQWRIHATYALSPVWQGKSRMECSRYEQQSAKYTGVLVFQDLQYTARTSGFSFAARMALFTIDDYQARIYAAEQDVLFQYAVPAFQGNGVRYYALIHYRASRKIDCWLKTSITKYYQQEAVGSGLTQVKGQSLADIRLQLRLSL
ncbi:MAG: helix-hairpin-helix domain-containing protein [Bacteroidia bacterium]|jgi:hypothetical protein|nr:helix-hairpin-helix domain-containing protein [Bacteroidia bacterium]